MRSFLLIISLFVLAGQSLAQNRFRSRTSGNWSTPSTWQMEASPIGSNIWSTALIAPDFSTADKIDIRSGHTITVTNSTSIDQTSVFSGAVLIVEDGVVLTVNNGTGVDLFEYLGGIIHLEGESNLAGPGYAYFGGELNLYSINGTGAITPGTSATGNVRTSSRAWGSSATVRYVGSAKQFLGAGHPTTTGVTTIINNAAGVEVNNATSTTVQLNGDLQIISGQFLIGMDDLSMRTGTTITVNGGSLDFQNASSARVHNLSNLTLTSGSISSTSVTSTSSLTVKINGDLDLQGGSYTINSGSVNNVLSVYGDISGSTLIMGTGNFNTINLFGSGNFSSAFPFAANAAIRQLTINRSGLLLNVQNSLSIRNITLLNGSIDFNADQVVAGSLNMTTGTSVDFSGVNLQIASAVNNTLSGGLLISNGGSSLTMNGATTANSTLNFAPGSTLNSFSINRSSGGSVTVASAVTVNGNLDLLKSSLNNSGGFLTLGSGVQITRNTQGSLVGSAPSGGPYDIFYSGTTLASGVELLGTVNNVTSNLSGTLTLSSALSIPGSLTINSGTFSAGSNAVSVTTLINGGTFNAPTSTLTLSGNLSSTGTLNMGTADLILTGTADQSITTSNVNQFNDITLTKTSGTVSINSSQNLRGVLTVSDGATFDADGTSDNAVFTLLSVGDVAGSDASIAPLGVSAVVMGNISVQRYWSASDDVYRYISSPVEGSTIQQLQDSGIPITGPFAQSSFPCTGCTDDFTNLGWYDETVPGFIWEGYQVMPSAGMDNTEALVSARGYELYMWNGIAPSLWTTTGVANQGSYPLEVSHTPSDPALPNEDGWSLVGNPYPSSIVWEDNTDLPGGWTINDVSPIVWVWDVTLQDWKFYDASSNSGNLTGGVIAAGQAFWVQALAGSPSLTVHENAKSLTSGQYYRTINNDITQLKVQVSNGEWESSAYLVNEGKVTDVPKFRKGVEGISLALMNLNGLSFARLNMQDQGEFPISLTAKKEGEYTFSFSTEGKNTDSYANLFLVDNYLHKSMPLGNYTFTITKDVSSYSGRFVISRNENPVSTTQEESSFTVYPNPVETELTVELTAEVKTVHLLSATGQLLVSKDQAEFNKSVTTLDVTGLQQGMYFIRVVKSDGSTYLHKIIKR